MNKIIIVFALTFLSVQSFAIKMTSAYEKSRVKGLLKSSVITFSDKGIKTVYRPSSIPNLMTGFKEVPADGKTFFITMWAYGSQSVMYRVFDSSKSLSKPLCEIVSFSDEYKYKIENGRLEIRALLIPSDPSFWRWMKCADQKAASK